MHRRANERLPIQKPCIQFIFYDIETALASYKEKYGQYPPDLSDPAAVQRHLSRVFPDYNASTYMTDLAAVGVNVNDMTPATALTFWLGGIPDRVAVPSLPVFAGLWFLLFALLVGSAAGLWVAARRGEVAQIAVVAPFCRHGTEQGVVLSLAGEGE